MIDDKHMVDLVFGLLGIAIGVFLLSRVIESVKSGEFTSYYGEQFLISKQEAPVTFWVLAVMLACISTVFILGGLLFITP